MMNLDPEKMKWFYKEVCPTAAEATKVKQIQILYILDILYDTHFNVLSHLNLKPWTVVYTTAWRSIPLYILYIYAALISIENFQASFKQAKMFAQRQQYNSMKVV